MLGITQATLYAYVSRGLLESRPGPDHRSRLYLRQDVERLAQRQRSGRGEARGAAQSLDRGLPVLETRISLIQPDGPDSRGSFGDRRSPRRSHAGGCRAAAVGLRRGRSLRGTRAAMADGRRAHRRRCHAAAAGTHDGGDPAACALQERHSFDSAPQMRHRVAATLLRQNAALLVAQSPAPGPVHALLAQAWQPGGASFEGLVRAALALCAGSRTRRLGLRSAHGGCSRFDRGAPARDGVQRFGGVVGAATRRRDRACLRADRRRVAIRITARGDRRTLAARRRPARLPPCAVSARRPARGRTAFAAARMRAGRGHHAIAGHHRRGDGGNQRPAAQYRFHAGRDLPCAPVAGDTGAGDVRRRTPCRMAGACTGTAGARAG